MHSGERSRGDMQSNLLMPQILPYTRHFSHTQWAACCNVCTRQSSTASFLMRTNQSLVSAPSATSCNDRRWTGTTTESSGRTLTESIERFSCA
eukprot:m.176341 g.176341  ORF g.176341 m.176341 type:complete len:93 (+) comp24437_c0_seq2:2198-2476(+)